MIRSVGRLWRTLRPLRAGQWVYWPLRRVQRFFPVPRPRADLSAAVAPSRAMAEELTAWGPGDPAERRATADRFLAGQHLHLGIPRSLPPGDWSPAGVPRLWAYQFHYLEALEDLAWAYRLGGDPRYLDGLLRTWDGWWAAHHGGRGVAWEPYVVAHRLIHWTNALLLVGSALPAADGRRAWERLWIQARSLAARLEHHLQGNHLQKDLAALAWVGAATDDAAAVGWTRRWTEAHWNAFRDQVTPDGVHAERSPMYHAAALLDLVQGILVARSAGLEPPADILALVRRMATAWEAVRLPAGGAWLLNDTALDALPDPRQLERVIARALGESVAGPAGAFAFPAGGWFGYRDEQRGERCFVDGAPPGPPHQPGHAHAGTFGLELHLAGGPVIVDPGVGGYEGHPERAGLRGTAAHATVAVAGEDSSEVWGAFRVGGRAVVHRADASAAAGGWRFIGELSPWRRPGVVQRREVRRDAPGDWRIEDEIRGAGGLAVTSGLPFHPDWRLEWSGTGGSLERQGVRIRITAEGFDRVERRDGIYSPRFGDGIPAPRLVGVRQGDGAMSWRLQLEPVTRETR